MRSIFVAMMCVCALACNKDVSAKDLVGNWKIDTDEVKKQADLLAKNGKAEAAAPLNQAAFIQMMVTFTADGKFEMKSTTPLLDSKTQNVYTASYVVTSAKDDTMNLSVTDAKGTEPSQVKLKGDSLFLISDKGGPSMPFKRSN